MNEPTNVWGTLSVLDHLRPNAFVAELMQFDTLVIPRPLDDTKWPEAWNVEQQHRLLSMIPNDRIMEVPWTEDRRDDWKKLMISVSAEADIRDVQRARTSNDHEGDKFDAPAFQVSRRILVDFVDHKRDEALIDGIPHVPVAVIPAYDSSDAYLNDAVKDQERLLQAFGWEFLVPSDLSASGKRLSHEDQIKAALDLSKIPEVKLHRDAFRAWTSLEALKGTSATEAKDKMEDLISQYTKAVASSKIPVKLKWGAGFAELLGAVAALTVSPAFALVSPVVKLGETAINSSGPSRAEVPPSLRPAALIHAARTDFSKKQMGLFGEKEPQITIQGHWPSGGPPPYL